MAALGVSPMAACCLPHDEGCSAGALSGSDSDAVDRSAYRRGRGNNGASYIPPLTNLGVRGGESARFLWEAERGRVCVCVCLCVCVARAANMQGARDGEPYSSAAAAEPRRVRVVLSDPPPRRSRSARHLAAAGARNATTLHAPLRRGRLMAPPTTNLRAWAYPKPTWSSRSCRCVAARRMRVSDDRGARPRRD